MNSVRTLVFCAVRPKVRSRKLSGCVLVSDIPAPCSPAREQDTGMAFTDLPGWELVHRRRNPLAAVCRGSYAAPGRRRAALATCRGALVYPSGGGVTDGIRSGFHCPAAIRVHGHISYYLSDLHDRTVRLHRDADGDVVGDRHRTLPAPGAILDTHICGV